LYCENIIELNLFLLQTTLVIRWLLSFDANWPSFKFVEVTVNVQYESSSVCITYFGDTCKTCLAFVGFQYVSGLEIFWVLLVYYQVPCMNGADWSILLCCCRLVLEELVGS